MVYAFVKPRKYIEPYRHRLVARAQEIVDRDQIPTRSLFCHGHRPLARTLRNRGVLDHLSFERERRNLMGMSKRKIIAYTMNIIDNAITRTLPKLREEDPYLVRVLRQRELLDDVIRIARKRGLMD